MYCPKCGAMPNDPSPYCTQCGAPMTPPKKKKGSLWPPLIFILIMLAIGIAVFLKYPADTSLSGTPWFTAQEDGIRFDPTLYSGSEELTVPDGVTALAEGCFRDCDGLTTVYLPEGLTRIGDEAFRGCGRLRGVKIPEGVTQIGAGAFQDCGALEALAIPQSVQSIGSGALEGCVALRHIFFEGTKSQWISLNLREIGKNVTVYCVDGSITPEDPNS